LLGLRPVVAAQTGKWNEVLRGVREMEPFGRLLTIHTQPNWPRYELIEDDNLIDF
jgi:hypothetical protein